MAKYLTEFIGTFTLMFTIGLSVTAGLAMAPLAIGCSLMIAVYMGGHVSGAHYNPAVTLAVLMRGKIELREVLPYVASQLLGAFLAAMVVYTVTGKSFATAPAADASAAGALLVEFIYTFVLALVVLNVTTAKATEGNSFYGLAIGFTIVVAAFAGGPVSGGAFNPAVGVGSILVNAIAGGGSLAHIWLYLVGPLAGGAVAAVVFKLQHADG